MFHERLAAIALTFIIWNYRILDRACRSAQMNRKTSYCRCLNYAPCYLFPLYMLLKLPKWAGSLISTKIRHAQRFFPLENAETGICNRTKLIIVSASIVILRSNEKARNDWLPFGAHRPTMILHKIAFFIHSLMPGEILSLEMLRLIVRSAGNKRDADPSSDLSFYFESTRQLRSIASLL